MKPQDVGESFWSKVTKTAEGCWLWTAAVNRRGKGRVRVSGRQREAHRVAWELLHGESPKGYGLSRTCANARCVNPAHFALHRGMCWRGGKTNTVDGYIGVRMPEHHRAMATGYVFEHVLVAERALGRPLAAKHPVHHVDGNKRNNVPSNLVICEDNGYHRLLHRRARALAAGGAR